VNPILNLLESNCLNMYDFLFWYFYRFLEWRKGFRSSFVAANLVCVTAIIHLLCAYSIVRFLTGRSFHFGSGTYGYTKLMWMIIVTVISAFVYLSYYKNKADAILRRYEGRCIFHRANVLRILAIFLVPLLVAIILSLT
jgi:uncharacterized membrane protein